MNFENTGVNTEQIWPYTTGTFGVLVYSISV